MKLERYVKETIEIKAITDRHAVAGQIVTKREIYCPAIVIQSYFERRYIDKYGLDSEEILLHGTNYVDVYYLETEEKERLQYYEYAIIEEDQEIRKEFLEKFKPEIIRKAIENRARKMNYYAKKKFSSSRKMFEAICVYIGVARALGNDVSADVSEGDFPEIKQFVFNGETVKIPEVEKPEEGW